MAEQHSLVLIKPDAVQRSLMGIIIDRFERKGLRICGLKLMLASPELAEQHYAVHAGKPFYDGLIRFITSAPLVAMMLAGEEAVSVVRTLIGSTDARKAPPGTIRGDYANSMSRNLVHASDSPESAAAELAIWFPEGGIAWSRCDVGCLLG